MKGAQASGAAARKAAIRTVLEDIAALAERAGLASAADDIRRTRLPKLEDERLNLVVLGEFNHGKSTFVNALLGEAILPVGITPTTAVLTHVLWAPKPAAELVLESGERRKIDPKKLADHLTVSGDAGAGGVAAHHVELRWPAPFVKEGLTLVDTPGVNDINEQRAEITYGYVPRADAVIFLLDATQILSASERRFLEERILRSSRDRLVFVVAKADLLDEGELAETLAFARRHLGAIVKDPIVFPISAKRALAGKAEAGGLGPLVAHLGATLGSERRRLVLDHALADAGRLAAFVRQSLGMRRAALELPTPELEERIARASRRLADGKRALSDAAGTIAAEAAGLKARVRQDLAAFARDFREALPPDLAKAEAEDIRRHLPFFIQDTWKAWAEAEAEIIAAELERLAENVIQVANENVADVARGVSADLGLEGAKLAIDVDTLRYDASVFALGALGTTVFFFVNTFVGGLLTLATPLLAILLRGKVAAEVRAEAQKSGPEAVDRAAALLGPKLEGLIDDFAARLAEFIAQAGDALAQGVSEVLDRALAERRGAGESAAAGREGQALDTALRELGAIDGRIADLRQAVWDD